MKRVLFFSIVLVLAFAPACKDEVRPLSPPLTIKINITSVSYTHLTLPTIYSV